MALVTGGSRSIGAAIAKRLATDSAAVALTDFENFSVFKPDARHEKSVNAVFDQVIAWGGALKTLREK